MSVSVRGFEDTCRLCAIESESGVIIYSAEGENLSLEQKIVNCLHIEVSRNDFLPKKVCTTCNALLEELHQFSCRAANAQQTLSFLFDLHLRQLQEQELNLLHNVKLEGNLIKNELEDLNHVQVHQGDGLCDISEQQQFQPLDLIPPCEAPLIDRSLPIFQTRSFAREKLSELPTGFSTVVVLNDRIKEPTILPEEEPRHNHRRKMLQPKRSTDHQISSGFSLDANGKLEEVDSVLDQHLLSVDAGKLENEVEVRSDVGMDREVADVLNGDSSDIQCLMDAESQDHMKPFNENDLFQGLEDEEILVNHEEEEEGESLPANAPRDWAIACATCREVFPHRVDFETHWRQNHDDKPVYTCSQCNKALTNFISYRSHYYRHQCKYSCLYCDKVFTLEGMLRVHVLSRHVTVRPFICEKCGKGYVTQYRLDIHRKQHDTDQKEFPCTQCDKVLMTRNGLSTHMTVHRFGRRFQCHLCGKTFTQKVNMQQHVKYHKGEKPFPCDLCNKRFAEKSQLKRHKSFHTLERPFQCPVCQKMYKTQRCLKVHSQVHEEIRPFVCSECGKGFLSVTKLKQHYHCHTGERPYACKYCERTFTNYPNWLKHTRRRHKVDHKTGVKLKEEEGSNATGLSYSKQLTQLSPIDLLDMTDVKVKDDEGTPASSLTTSLVSQCESINENNSTDLSFQFQYPHLMS